VAGRRAHGARRARSRGRSQHFLRSAALAEAIVEQARVLPDDLVLDVGAGFGRLTAALAARGCCVHAIEVDAELAARLRKRFAGSQDVIVVEADVLRVKLPCDPFRVVANLPFAGGHAILRRLLASGRLERADVILEWEAARKRAACWPSTLLGVCWGVRYEFQLVRRLPARCFQPPPRVDAGLLRIEARETPLVAPPAQDAFCRFAAAGFRGGDRPLRTPFRGRAYKRVTRELGLQPSARPSDLDVHQWAAVFAAVRSHGDA
jgi:23S rRNA (adenine-N6)-dimethyltransferase